MLNNRAESGLSLFEVVIFITLFSVILAFSLDSSQRFAHDNKHYAFAQQIDFYFERLQQYARSGKANFIDGVNEVSLSDLIDSEFISKFDTGVIDDYKMRFFVKRERNGDLLFTSPLLVAFPLNGKSFSPESVSAIENYLGKRGGKVDSFSGDVSGNWGAWYLKANDWDMHFDSRQIVAFASGFDDVFSLNVTSNTVDTTPPAINEIALSYFNVGKLQQATIKVVGENEIEKTFDWTPVFYEDRFNLTIDGSNNTLSYLVEIKIKNKNNQLIRTIKFVNTTGMISLEPNNLQVSNETEIIINVSLTPVSSSESGENISFVIHKRLPENLSINDIWDNFKLYFSADPGALKTAELCKSGGKKVPPDDVQKIIFTSRNKRLLFETSLSFMNVKFFFHEGMLPNIYNPNITSIYSNSRLSWLIPTSPLPSFCAFPENAPPVINALLSIGGINYDTTLHLAQSDFGRIY
ncbi:TPA: hypothetical protein J1070_004547, partial [Escherichia coli]|nr:hypothetical protein [Escherichia coli]